MTSLTVFFRRLKNAALPNSFNRFLAESACSPVSELPQQTPIYDLIAVLIFGVMGIVVASVCRGSGQLIAKIFG